MCSQLIYNPFQLPFVVTDSISFQREVSTVLRGTSGLGDADADLDSAAAMAACTALPDAEDFVALANFLRTNKDLTKTVGNESPGRLRRDGHLCPSRSEPNRFRRDGHLLGNCIMSV